MLKSFVFLFGSLLLLMSFHTGNRSAGNYISRSSSFKGPILWTVDCSPRGYCAIGGNDNLLRLYGTKTLKTVKTFQLKSAVQCLDWNQSGTLLAIALDGKPVRLFNIETGVFVELKGTSGSRALAWNHDGEMLATGDYDGLLYIWNKQGKLLNTIRKENTKTYLSVDWHPKNNTLLTGSDKIRIFDTAGNLLKNIKHRREETIILTVRWHPDGKFFASGDYGHKEEGIQSLLQFWQADGTFIKSLPGSKAEYRNIRWNHDGSLLATASDALRLWSKNGKLVYSGNTAHLLWGIDWCENGQSIMSGSELGEINKWTNKAILQKSFY